MPIPESLSEIQTMSEGDFNRALYEESRARLRQEGIHERDQHRLVLPPGDAPPRIKLHDYNFWCHVDSESVEQGTPEHRNQRALTLQEGTPILGAEVIDKATLPDEESNFMLFRPCDMVPRSNVAVILEMRGGLDLNSDAYTMTTFLLGRVTQPQQHAAALLLIQCLNTDYR
ncbi:MAG: hypothetical protein JWL85_835 [Candidatus Saccharibacteria bacterium]|nr:hypothetical protein [Candidatus Saccharibacteria bacterium]